MIFVTSKHSTNIFGSTLVEYHIKMFSVHNKPTETVLQFSSLFKLYKTESERNIKNLNHKTNDVRYTARKLSWRGGCRMRSCQEIKCFWRTLSCLNIILTRWNFGARNEIFRFAFLLFLWDNASQKLRMPSHYEKCESLICTTKFTPLLAEMYSCTSLRNSII